MLLNLRKGSVKDKHACDLVILKLDATQVNRGNMLTLWIKCPLFLSRKCFYYITRYTY